MSEDLPIEIYTDGACSPNPGPGGYGVIIVRDGERTELSGGYRNTTNNRMEMMAALKGLKALPVELLSQVTLYSDSRYLVDMFNRGHARKWRANGWRLASKLPAQNQDLWGTLLDLADGSVKFVWVKGHNEHPENERCDELAVNSRLQNDLPPDCGYETPRAGVQEEQLALF
jgi:ribonuclease HI